MPDWQIVTDAYARLLKARALFDAALVEVIGARNSEAVPMLELLAAEVERLKRAVLDSLGSSAAVFDAGP
jgi:hypothetical protein